MPVKSITSLLVIMVFFSITFSASATPNTGQLYKICKSGAIDKPSKTYCLAFILGVYDGLLNNCKHELSIKKNKRQKLPPSAAVTGIRYKELVKIFMVWAKKNPEEWKNSVTSTSVKWLQEDYPCEK